MSARLCRKVQCGRHVLLLYGVLLIAADFQVFLSLDVPVHAVGLGQCDNDAEM